MFVSDLSLLIRFWAVVFLIGAAAYPLTRQLFAGWWDEGYAFAKAVGMATVTFLAWYTGSLRILPFTFESISLSVIALFLLGLYVHRLQKRFINNKAIFRQTKNNKVRFLRIIISELIFLGLFLFWAWVKGHEASIQGLEKFMDYGFTMSILNARYFPPPDMWYSGFTINYYYFGHVVMATLTRLSGIDLAYTFNFMLALIFALCATMSYSLGVQLFVMFSEKNEENRLGRSLFSVICGAFTSFLLTLGGNMQTIYAFTRGYTGEDVKPFWELAWKAGEFFEKLPEGMTTYWYANATRFIPFTIHEFPSYSFVVSDLHGHVLAIPFALLTIALLVKLFGFKKVASGSTYLDDIGYWFFGIITGILFMTNTLDGLIYSGLFLIFVMLMPTKEIKWSADWFILKGRMLVGLLSALPVVLPFVANFNSFVNGLAVNCPPAILAGRRFGPLIFEEVEKCQRSPFWMLFLLWGFFWVTGIRLLWPYLKSAIIRILALSGLLIFRRDRKNEETLLIDSGQLPVGTIFSVMFGYSVGLVLFAELFYFKDIYPAHFRSNTMFKLGYQAFMMFSLISGVSLVREILLSRKRSGRQFWSVLPYRVFVVFALFLVSIYPFFSVRSYFNNLTAYTGLYGLKWLSDRYPDDFAAISYLNQQIDDGRFDYLAYRGGSGGPVITEADGDSYTDYARVSAFTGLPTVIGWGVHEWLWRGTYDVVAPRRDDMGRFYQARSIEEVKNIIAKYDIRFVMVGDIEREKYPDLNEDIFSEIGTIAFEQGQTKIYQVGFN
jgi:YYY domain-containing protein